MAGIEGRTVLLTGASGAIGAATARRLAAEGARLALAGRREERLDELAEEIAGAGGAGPRPLTLCADLARRGEAAGLAARAAEQLGGIDALSNNAGTSMQGVSWLAGDGDASRDVFEAI